MSLVAASFAESFAGWRAVARELLRRRVLSARVLWRGHGDQQPAFDGLAEDAPVVAAPADAGREQPSGRPRAARVPRDFLAAGERVACHRDPGRWALLYRLLWRLTHGEPRLLDVVVDDDVHRLTVLDKAVRRDVHKLHAFVRFRRVERDGEEHYVAWFAPEHYVVEYATPFFARRFSSMRWSVLTPHRSAFWDMASLRYGPGVPRTDAPAPDALEALWRTYYAHIFNPARANPAAMRAEMPRKYWANLPEASLIPELLSDAPRRVRRMLDEQTRPPALVACTGRAPCTSGARAGAPPAARAAQPDGGPT